MDEAQPFMSKNDAYYSERRKKNRLTMDVAFVEAKDANPEFTARKRLASLPGCKLRLPRTCLRFAAAGVMVDKRAREGNRLTAAPVESSVSGRCEKKLVEVVERVGGVGACPGVEGKRSEEKSGERRRIMDTALDSKMMMLEDERGGRSKWFKKMRDSVRRAMRTYRCQQRFGAVHRVPPEVWSYLFLFCLPSASDDGENYYLDPAQNTAPLLLCSVCHTWRSAATQTQQLWNTLTIHLRGQSTPRLPGLQTWITRAGALPLDLHILWGPTQSLQHHDRVLGYLLTLTPRWRRVRLSVVRELVWQAHGFSTRARRLLAYTMPALEELELERYPSFTVENLQGNAPALRVLRLADAVMNPMLLMARAPWACLVVFQSVYPLGVLDGLKVLKMCPVLEECEMAVTWSNAVEMPRTSATPVVMQRLRKLVVNETLSHVVDAFLRQLELPRLEEMRLCAERAIRSESRELWTVRELLLLVHRSREETRDGDQTTGPRCTLQRLEIYGLNCDEGNVTSLWVGIPSLIALDVKNELEGNSWVGFQRTTTQRVDISG